MDIKSYLVIQFLVFVFVFVFDAIDLRPQIHSFGFFKSYAYWAYFAVRLVLSSVAALVMYAADKALLPPVIALVGVIASVTVLQSFSLNVGGKDIANLNNLLDVYKKIMISDESDRRTKRDDASVLEIVEKLLSKYKPEELEMILRRMLLRTHWQTAQINQHMKENEQAAAGDRDLLGDHIGKRNSRYESDICPKAAFKREAIDYLLMQGVVHEYVLPEPIRIGEGRALYSS